MNTLPGSRAEAKAAGSRHYFTGRPCSYGHIAPRFTGNGWCGDCSKIRVADTGKRGYYRERYLVNAEKVKEQSRRRYSENRERCAAQAAAWIARNPDKRKAISRQYKARRRAQEDAGITGGMLAEWTLAQPKVCFYCDEGCAGDFHVDHFMPLAKGGAHVLTNLRIACPACNLRKNAKLPDEWIEEFAEAA